MAFFHVDAAQSIGKATKALHNPRIDLVSISAHKFHGPKGVGALAMRRRGFARPSIRPLVYGGGQERGIRPGTQTVHQIVGIGAAAELATGDEDKRTAICRQFRSKLVSGLAPLKPELVDKDYFDVLAFSVEFLNLCVELCLTTSKVGHTFSVCNRPVVF